MKVKIVDIAEDILAEIGGIKVTLGGSYITKGKDENGLVIV